VPKIIKIGGRYTELFKKVACFLRHGAVFKDSVPSFSALLVLIL